MSVRTKKNSHIASNWGEWLKSNGLMLLAIIFVLPLVWKYLRNFLQSEKDKLAEDLAKNPTQLRTEMDAVADGYSLARSASFIQSQAKVVYESFNIPESWYSWLNPGNWYEDDETAYKAILAVTSGVTGHDFEYMQLCYTMISGGKRDMYTDCAKYLDKKYFNLISGW